jgi:hypothetical protein
MSAVEGEHTGAGLVIVSTGASGICGTITLADSTEVHPEELVTVKTYDPGARLLIVAEVPVPVCVIPAGTLLMVHAPLCGNPFSTALPWVMHVGPVIVPGMGAAGVGGWALMTMLPDKGEVQPAWPVTVKLYVPGGRPAIVVEAPEPVMDTVPGYLTIVHAPVAGNPVSSALPVAAMHVGWTMFPAVGAAGIAGCGFITAAAEAADVHPDAFVTVNV